MLVITTQNLLVMTITADTSTRHAFVAFAVLMLDLDTTTLYMLTRFTTVDFVQSEQQF